MPLDELLDQIDVAFNAKIYYAALLITLTIPDICAALSKEKSDRVDRGTYEEWCKNYLHRDTGIEPEDIFKLRCGVVHRANPSSHSHVYFDRHIFTIPESGRSTHGLGIYEPFGPKAAMLDLRLFCNQMKEGALRWYAAHSNEATVIANLPNVIRFRPDGILPFTEGYPVVA